MERKWKKKKTEIKKITKNTTREKNTKIKKEKQDEQTKSKNR